MLSTWGTKLKGASETLGLVLWRKIANRKAVYSWSVFLMKRPPTKTAEEARVNYLQANHCSVKPTNYLSQSYSVMLVLWIHGLIIFIITTTTLNHGPKTMSTSQLHSCSISAFSVPSLSYFNTQIGHDCSDLWNHLASISRTLNALLNQRLGTLSCLKWRAG